MSLYLYYTLRATSVYLGQVGVSDVLFTSSRELGCLDGFPYDLVCFFYISKSSKLVIRMPVLFVFSSITACDFKPFLSTKQCSVLWSFKSH